jgi:hypothetical protein
MGVHHTTKMTNKNMENGKKKKQTPLVQIETEYTAWEEH